jgi:hypothetical protein
LQRTRADSVALSGDNDRSFNEYATWAAGRGKAAVHKCPTGHPDHPCDRRRHSDGDRLVGRRIDQPHLFHPPLHCGRPVRHEVEPAEFRPEGPLDQEGERTTPPPANLALHPVSIPPSHPVRSGPVH